MTGRALSERELEVLALAAEGYGDADIADKLHLAINTVKVHHRRARAALGARDRAQAVVLAMRTGQLPLHPLGIATPIPPLVALLGDHVGALVRLRLTDGSVRLCRVVAVDASQVSVALPPYGQAAIWGRADVLGAYPVASITSTPERTP